MKLVPWLVFRFFMVFFLSRQKIVSQILPH